MAQQPLHAPLRLGQELAVPAHSKLRHSRADFGGPPRPYLNTAIVSNVMLAIWHPSRMSLSVR